MKRRWVPIAVLGAMYVAGIVTLVTCFVMAQSRGHLDGWGPLPPISALGDQSPEHYVFNAGFVVLCVGLSVVAWMRHGQIEKKLMQDEEKKKERCCNGAFFIITVLFMPPLVIAGSIPTRAWGSELGLVHGASAGVGLIGMSSVSFWLHVYLFVLQCRGTNVERHERVARLMYGWTVLVNAISVAFFAVFFLNPDQTQFEWAGFVLLWSGQVTYFFYFWTGHQHQSGEYQRLTVQSGDEKK